MNSISNKGIDFSAVKNSVSLPDYAGRFIELKKKGSQYVGLCPFHDDHKPSFRIYRGDDGVERYRCFACGAGSEGGDIIDFCKAINNVDALQAVQILKGDMPAESGKARKRPKLPADKSKRWKPIIPVPDDAPKYNPAKTFNPKSGKIWKCLPSRVDPYSTRQGKIICYVIRLDFDDGEKMTPTITYCEGPDGQKRWCSKRMKTPFPLQGLNDLAKRPDANVLVVSGEKCKEYGDKHLQGFVTVTLLGGDRCVDKADLTPLQGRRVVLFPDADKSGRQAMLKTGRRLVKLGCKIRYIDTKDLSNGYDLADLVDDGVTGKDLKKWCADRVKDGLPVIQTDEPKPAKTERQAHDLKIIELKDVEPRSVEWLWEGHIPQGKLVLLGGMPDTGKTTITHSIISTLSKGGRFPFTSEDVEPADTLILTCEDDAADTVVPRLMAAGADLSKIAIIQSVIRWDEKTGEVRDKPLTLAQDMHQLDVALTERPNTKLVVFDPISAYLGVKDSHRDADVREVLGPLCVLAAEHMVTVLGITHLNKTAGADAMSRFLGSTGIVAAARAAYMTIKVDGQLMMLKVKANLAPNEESGGLKYEIKSVTIDGGIETSRIEWTGSTDIDPNDALATLKQKVSSPKLTAAKQFLEQLLAMGPKKQTEIEADGISQGHSKATIRRAKNELGIQSHKDRFTGGWKWYTDAQFQSIQGMNDGL